MKNLLSIIAFTIAVINFTGCQSKSNDGQETISFYRVPLVCGAASQIGCGSRAKPALIELEQNSAVREAWLNRPGTAIAIVWKDKSQTKTVTKPILSKNNISYQELSGKTRQELHENFRKENIWFRGADVDVLSREEAETIAENSVNFALNEGLINVQEGNTMKNEVKDYFKKELVKIRTNEQLNDDSEHKFRNDLLAIAEKHIGKDRAKKAMALYEENMKKQCEKDQSCNAPGTKDCCDK